MRIVIDLQGAQSSGSRNRGIGRYSQDLTLAMLKNRGDNEVLIALNSLFPDTIESIRAALKDLLPQENIRVWESVGPISANNPLNEQRRKVAEVAREAFLASLNPDVVLNTSLFEGLEDDAITSIGKFSNNLNTAVILYDLIPLIHNKIYLQNPIVSQWYLNKLDQLRRADLLLSISASSGNEAVEYLGFPSSQVVNISTACDKQFKSCLTSERKKTYLKKTYNITRPFVMYTGGNDWRKNVEGLISAYATLPKALRSEHQLAIVCSTFPALLVKWQKIADEAGLSSDELVITGFVPDEDLLLLYNACKLFVFPSWHEGFGLPALEAMACGRAVIGANTSSVPEVIGYENALFDPFENIEISRKIQEVLENDDFRTQLESQSLSQSLNFSWDETARRAWAALEDLAHKQKQKHIVPSIELASKTRRPRLAYFSPLPPEQSGISDYSAELLPELSRHYEIEVIVSQTEILDDWVHGNTPIRDIAWFRANSNSFDRVMYHFGNSEFHSHMFALLEEFPGVVVLHDFFLSGIVAYLDGSGVKPHSWARALVNGHGWTALKSRYTSADPSEVVYAYPCNLEVLQQALGVITHSNNSGRLAENWFGAGAAFEWSVVPLLRLPVVKIDKKTARQKFRLSHNSFVVCSFGHLGTTKLNERLISAWLLSPLAQDPDSYLIFVGQNSPGDYGLSLVRAISGNGCVNRIEITGWTDAQDYKAWLTAADVGVQLRTLSRGETSAAVLDCMNYGLATIVNANGAMADLPENAVLMLPDDFSDVQLADALTGLWNDVNIRKKLGQEARSVIQSDHQPRRCAAKYAEAIERYYKKASVGVPALGNTISRLNSMLQMEDTRKVAKSIANNFPPFPRKRQLLLDISELVLRDSKTGIQRVVRSYLMDLLLNPPKGFRVEPVYASADAPGYRYARCFTCKFLGVWEGWAEDDFTEVWSGDVFLGLEWQPAVAVPAQKNQLLEWRHRGVKVLFVVYDLLPVLQPQAFPIPSQAMHQHWLETISCFDGALCISRSVADEMYDWLQAFGDKRERAFNLAWFHLGADVENSVPTTGMPASATQLLSSLESKLSFLMVGTVEPRKGYLQTIAAFTELWLSGHDVNLVIVGQEGWKSLPDDLRRTIPEIIDKILNHSEFGKKLFWLEGISDEYLEKVYDACSCLIAASEGEGFGLPLIEGAQHGLPIIARDIPVFREVADIHAFYFSGLGARDLSESVLSWISLHQVGNAPQSTKMPWLTWKQSTKDLLEISLHGKYYRQWISDDANFFWGGDSRFGTQIGTRTVREMISNRKAGYLIFGPYISIIAGDFLVKIRGSLGEDGLAGAHMDVVVNQGSRILGRSLLNEPDDDGNLVTLHISLDSPSPDLEVRVWVSDMTDLKISMLEIAPYKFDGVLRFLGSDGRFGTQVGLRNGRNMQSTSQAGYLLFGPYIALSSGRYRILLRGALGQTGSTETKFDVAIEQGSLVLNQSIVSYSDLDGALGSLIISLETDCTDLEIRVWISENTDLKISAIEIIPLYEDHLTDDFFIERNVPVNITEQPAQLLL